MLGYSSVSSNNIVFHSGLSVRPKLNNTTWPVKQCCRSPKLDFSWTHLYYFDIWQTVQEGLQINTIKDNTVVKDMSIRFEINHCLFLWMKKENVANILIIVNLVTCIWKRAALGGRTDLEVREHVGVISNEERVGHVGKFFWILIGHLQRWRLLVSDDVVHEGSPTGSRVTQPHTLIKKKHLVNYLRQTIPCILSSTEIRLNVSEEAFPCFS